jgi:UTP--glucose-1-phosphate uridylyltransferase
MKITKALITAAGPDQRKLPLQTLIDRDRTQRTVLEILINEIKSAGIDDIGIVIQPEDEKSFEQVLDSSSYSSVRFIHQNNKPGYGQALLSAETF